MVQRDIISKRNRRYQFKLDTPDTDIVLGGQWTWFQVSLETEKVLIHSEPVIMPGKCSLNGLECGQHVI